MTKPFSAEYFDETFYTDKSGEKGWGGRDKNVESYIEFARRFNECFKNEKDCKTVLDIGAGLGIRTTNHIANGYDAYPCDISRWAFENSKVPDKHFCCDVRELDKIDKTFDVVITERILGYIPPQDSLLALEQINRKAEKYFVFSIITTDHPDKVNVVEIAKVGRKNLQPSLFWENLFKKFPWRLDREKTDIMCQQGWFGIWVFKKLSMFLMFWSVSDMLIDII